MSEVKHKDSSDGFIAVDVDELAQELVVNSSGSSSSSPRLDPAVKKILTRKGSQTGGGGGGGGAGGGEQQQQQHGASKRSALSVHAAAEETSTPNGGRWNNRVGTRRPFSPWLNPNRVVIVFAALSSMGTLILLYFTLSMVKFEN